MLNLSLDDIERLVAAVNAQRAAQAGTAWQAAHADEMILDRLYQCSQRLAVYGSLAPGQSNYHVVAPLGGDWVPGVVHGELVARGRGAALGYRSLLPGSGSGVVAVQVLTTPALMSAWTRLDEFEGNEYRRVLIAVVGGDGGADATLLTVANVYVAAEPTLNAPAG